MSNTPELDSRLAHLWETITRTIREVRELKPRMKTIERRLDRLESTTAQNGTDHDND